MWLRLLLIFYGAINIAGGLFAFMSPKIHSVWSLVVGGTVGVLLVLSGVLAFARPSLGFKAGAVLCALLMAFWCYRISEVLRAGGKLMNPVGNLGLAVVVLGVLTWAHFAAAK